MEMLLPNVIGIGFGRTGTTFIADVLRSHPEVCFSLRKETHFFSGEDFGRGLPFYAGYFRHYDSKSHKVIAEWSNEYILSEVALRRIRELLGDRVKLLVCYRDPTEALLSRIRMDMMNYLLDSNFRLEDVLEKKKHYIEDLFYDVHLERAYAVFPGNSILVMNYDDMRANPAVFFRSLYEFIGISDLPVDSQVPRPNVSLPFKNRKIHGLLYFFLKSLYGKTKARTLLARHPKDKPFWLRAVQNWNAKDVALDAGLREELEKVFLPHMRRLDSLLRKG